MRPTPSPEHHAAHERVLPDELQPFLDLAEGLGPVDASVAGALLAARDRQPVDDHRRHEERHRVERSSASASWSTFSDEMMPKSPMTVATPASSEKMIAAIGNVP